MQELFIAYEGICARLNSNLSFLNIFKWIGTASMFTSAVLISVSPIIADSPLSFLGFFAAHCIWLLAALAEGRDKPLIWLNLTFIPIDLWAIGIRTIQ